MSLTNEEIELINARRETVIKSYDSAKATNHQMFLEGDVKATSEYIYPNQIEDANNIILEFRNNNRRVISIQKKTKVGADGLMIQIATGLTTHIDDEFVVNPANVRIITGMSNASWEKDMIEKAPGCFKNKIFHHGKLSKADLTNLQNALIIIDEIDTGDKECQRLHGILKDAGILDVNYMNTYNIRFVFISATMIKELYDLYRWGELHRLYMMKIPSSYIGHKEFLDMGIVQEFYSLRTQEKAEEWVQTDIIDKYREDYRVHIVRVKKNVDVVQNACICKNVVFMNHTSDERLSDEKITYLFKNPLTQHVVLGVKGFFRRANLIPYQWKLRIGATHEYHTPKVDYNVQIQGLTGRMTGYWKDDILKGHKTGPHRTSIKAIEAYEKVYKEPFGCNSYQTADYNKKNGIVIANPTMLSTKNICNIEAIDLPIVNDPTNPATVPFVLNIKNDEYVTIKRNGGKWDYSTIVPIIQKYKPEIIAELGQIEKDGGKDQIVEPDVDATTYRAYITEFVNAFKNKKLHKHEGNIKDKKKDTFQIYLDKVEYRIIISIQYGSKTVEN
jgi:hypothetical protein